MRYLWLFLTPIVLLSSCTKEDELTFFRKGKRVDSGLVWQKSPVTPEEILKGKKVTEVFSDTFDRPELGPHWLALGGEWRIEKGSVFSPKANNHNLVLTGISLPDNAVIELTMWSESPFIDVKFNAWGDGKDHEHGDGYTFILGGWKNRISVISRLHEHERNRVEDRTTRLEPATPYRVKVIRLGGKIWWFVNDEIFLAYYDPQPLSSSAGYRYFSLANWESLAFFDNVRISAIE